jgi:hypothetical protein
MSNIFTRKQTHFVLWRAAKIQQAPRLILGRLAPQPSPTFQQMVDVALTPSPNAAPGWTDLWEIAASDLRDSTGARLPDGVYHYWFKVENANVYDNRSVFLHRADPHAYVVDWRQTRDDAPASVIGIRNGRLYLCDADGSEPSMAGDPSVDSLAPNAKLVLYEVPTAWTRGNLPVTADSVGVGTFQDVQRLVDGSAGSGTFAPPARHLINLGVTGIQLLPTADSDKDRSKWGYGTSNYLAPDFDLAFNPADPNAVAAAARDFSNLVLACHQAGLRVFIDVVMAFADNDPYRTINFTDFHIHWGANDPEQQGRDGFGGDLWKYNYWVRGFRPLSGNVENLVPGREHMKSFIAHWVEQYRVDGVRLDSITNVKNFDFMNEFRHVARDTFHTIRQTHADDRFLVLGESLPVDMAYLGVGDALWNEKWKQIVRAVVVGENWNEEPSFEWSVRKLIQPTHLGYSDLAQAINYIGSHDVEGAGNERFYDYLRFRNVADKLPRFKLAFASLFTAVGIPMIFAGDEFADQQDIDIWNLSAEQRREKKQTDPVNYDRLSDPWRRELCTYVSRLAKLRTSEAALQVNDTNFIHVDFNDGKRVLAWVRGPNQARPVVVVANFSNWGTDVNQPNAEYWVPNWPGRNRDWFEVTQQRRVPAAWVGREPLMPWEAKVYVPA